MKRLAIPAALATCALSLSPTALLGTAQAATTLPTLSLTLTKTTIAVSGATQSGAVNVVSSATGTKEAAAILFALRPGVTVAEVTEFLKTKKAGDADAAGKYGSIVFDAEVNPGQKSEAQTVLHTGQYLALVAEGEGGPNRYVPFTVTAAPSPAALPAPEATERTIEFGFRGPKTLHDGELVRFENEGYLVHMDVAFPVKSMKAAKKVLADLLSGREKGLEKMIAGPPVGFAGPISHEGFQQEVIAAKPGIYVQVCFMETQDGRDHTRLGMERIIKIAK
ncbi:MAG TPA: hypothetical protein VMG62_04620 [Solirubrobacteraceae bacterium]|nr:hypothetical protein [Solirubrobacteraceae bacterium]